MWGKHASVLADNWHNKGKSLSLQRTDVANANQIELAAFTRAMKRCLQLVPVIHTLVTDQKKDVLDYVRQELGDRILRHSLDSFHVKKGFMLVNGYAVENKIKNAFSLSDFAIFTGCPQVL